MKNGNNNLAGLKKSSDIYYKIEKALILLEKKYTLQPDLDEISNDVFLSKFHFLRIFRELAGITPKKFLQYLTVEHAKKLLEKSRSILDVTMEVGLSSPGRLHDLFITCEAMTPGEYKLKGKGLKIFYGVHPTPFGRCVISVTEKGICSFDFLKENKPEKYISRIKKTWPNAEINRDNNLTAKYVANIFTGSKNNTNIPVLLKGTDFQIKVWKALLKIPEGFVLSYEDLAALIGQKKAVRAVASAVAKNPVSYIIPCHRVIRKMGIIGNYGGGRIRKKVLLGYEFSKNQ